ncbi:FeoC-like transcriptional regulator [Microbispora sp. H10830]|uniref:FeoC-like transcriptional regulator n=1 Tax=unclassified Microbispora TaxID=2614687 RepID=UPI001601E119|nr:FeoC-like transcriptional regulator [Microbispora sp. H10830]
MSALRRVLEEITAARGGVSLDDIARRLGLGRDEVDAMVEYWVRKGRLSSDDIAAACPSGGCGTCALGDDGKPGCGTRRDGPVLLAITVRRREDRREDA